MNRTPGNASQARFILLTLLLLLLLCFVGCKRSGEQCRPHRVEARAAWLRYRMAVLSAVKQGVANVERAGKRAKERMDKLNKVKACAKRAAPGSSVIPQACLQQAGVTPSFFNRDEEDKRMVSELERTNRWLIGVTKRIGRVDAVVKQLDCPATALRRAASAIPADPGPRARLLRAATTAAERLVTCADEQSISGGPHCR